MLRAVIPMKSIRLYSRMSSLIAEQKRELRKRVKGLLSQVNEIDAAEQSQSVTEKVRQLPAYQHAKSISIFMSMPKHEISTVGIVRDALRKGKIVFIPYIHAEANSKSKVMSMLRLKDENDLANLKPDAWGIPSIDAVDVENREKAFGGKGLDSTSSQINLDLVFMPGMAFDQTKNRLGHGKGFYDKYLSQVHAATERDGGRFPNLVGLALREQLLAPEEQIPVNEHDWRIDELIIAD